MSNLITGMLSWATVISFIVLIGRLWKFGGPHLAAGCFLPAMGLYGLLAISIIEFFSPKGLLTQAVIGVIIVEIIFIFGSLILRK